jgi:hypothetical protein
MAKTKLTEIHFDHALLDAEEKKFWQYVNAIEGAARAFSEAVQPLLGERLQLSRGTIVSVLEERRYGIPRGANGPRHAGGPTRVPLNEKVVQRIRELRAAGRGKNEIVEQIWNDHYDGVKVPKGMSESSLRRKYIPIVFDHPKKRRRLIRITSSRGSPSDQRVR